MIQEVHLRISPEAAANADTLKSLAAKKAGVSLNDIRHLRIHRRSIDARQRQVKVDLRLQLFIGEDYKAPDQLLPDYPDVSKAKEEVLIIGAGPAGLFAALKCIEQGQRPIVIERGKDVQARRRDLRAITVEHQVNPDSNYCFGEGGAGTYSDGKLYTRSKKRGDVRRVLQLLVGFGAEENILIEAHPHIGTNKLPRIIARMREMIIERGGVVLFDTRMTDILIEADQVKGIKTAAGDTILCEQLILATGHSARDVFRLLMDKGIAMEAKPFALGVRVEHPQTLIDRIQYHCKADRGPYLPAAPYRLVKQVGGRGVYSFCMCPGGVIAPCATAPGELVTNGWSPSKRDLPFANSGIVVELQLADMADYADQGPLMAMAFQAAVEQKAWALAGKTQAVPAQRLNDFISKKRSKSLPESSYKPGLVSMELGEVLPAFVVDRLRAGFELFGKAMRGYVSEEAVVHAPESRTSSPVRIPRDRENLQHPRIKGLYPCGEGAGYAGGIVSAAIDGEKCAMATFLSKPTGKG